MIHKEFMDILASRSGSISESNKSDIPSRPSTSQASSRRTVTSQSTVKSRISERSRRSNSVKRVRDANLESEKLRAELNLLYVEKQEAEQELAAIRDEICQKESVANSSSLASSAQLEALEIGSRLETTQQELFRVQRDNRSVIDELSAQLEDVSKQYEDLKVGGSVQ